MAILLAILIILTCTILILAVLVQNPKGGGLASGFSSGSQVMGVRRTADFLEKATWTLAVLLFVFSIASSSSAGQSSGTGTEGTSTTKDKVDDFKKQTPANQAAPGMGGPPSMPKP
ncbi:MAG: preprotein translocase subunit SecG [Bacteroidota bacterium]|nr:preprotein translocase subunit SecG [Bacteroidota bacterium]